MSHTDTNTPTITISDITPESYRLASMSDKTAMRRIVDNAIKSEMSHDVGDIDVSAVKSLFALQAALVPVRPEKAEKDYVALVARRVVVLATASEMLRNGTVRPDGIPDETDFSGLSAAIDAVTVDESVMSDATDIAGRKVTKSANQYDVAEIITNAFEDVKSGTFMTIRQICAKSDYPHDGAVAARLFPKSGTCTVDGIVPVDRTATNVRGARKM